MKSDVTKPGNAGPAINRRKMLMRLGLAATAIYAAPVLLQLSEAKASGSSGPNRGGRTVRRRVRRAASQSGPSGRHQVRRPYRAQAPQRQRISSGPSFSR